MTYPKQGIFIIAKASLRQPGPAVQQDIF